MNRQTPWFPYPSGFGLAWLGAIAKALAGCQLPWTRTTGAQLENFEVSPVARLVAVAVTRWPVGRAATPCENDACPDASVVTFPEPTSCSPCPEPEGSQTGFANS